MPLSLSLPLALAASVVEALIGYPAPLYRAIGHPVTWMGRWLEWLEAKLNREDASFAMRRASGVVALCLYLAPVALIAWAATRMRSSPRRSWLRGARRSRREPAGPTQSLKPRQGGGGGSRRAASTMGRRAVALIVGRNPAALDEAGVARAAIESLAENFSDGVVAPILWTALGGLTGGALYKAINTADSMIGHKDDRYVAFGWAAARLDDLVNLPASRLAALWLILAAGLTPGASARAAARAVWRDASLHRSPNAGWPEAAMAGALGLKLAGPRVYGDTLIDDAFMGAGRREADAADIKRALRALRACLRHPGNGAGGGGGDAFGLSGSLLGVCSCSFVRASRRREGACSAGGALRAYKRSASRAIWTQGFEAAGSSSNGTCHSPSPGAVSLSRGSSGNIRIDAERR